MRTVVLSPRPIELDHLIERRHRLGQDVFDEVWEGSYHMVPIPGGPNAVLDHDIVRVLDPLAEAAGLFGSGPFNLGVVDDFRVPDHGYHRQVSPATWFSTAAMVVEILSPDDETCEKFPFYAAHDVEEIILVHPVNQSVSLWQKTSRDGYGSFPDSRLLGVTAVALASAIRWPETTT